LRRGLPVCLRDSSAALLLAPPSPTSTYTLSLHDALPIYKIVGGLTVKKSLVRKYLFALIAFVLLAGTVYQPVRAQAAAPIDTTADRKSTRLNSSHVKSSYAVFCLKKKTRRHLALTYWGRD